ncbi:Glycosyl transferase family 2 [Arthrobacter ulcerisalmonis]|uniref:Glycosyl transferase family 2 n=1 Tax=Arthrobacter ulcerisalmonis TaxID=2483813 RepID=A0A3P5XGT3_9MICC|nr:Glycosyl transferase family 2 [Arthrobacter ulcerisalmonis]
MVSHNGSAYLPRTLSALADQTRPVDRTIGVDTSSRDDSLRHLTNAFGADQVTSYRAHRGGLGAALKAGLASLAPSGGNTAGEWIWLLHDDSAPDPRALAELLTAVELAPSVTVAGCKQLDWDSNRHLIDVGLSISRWAERLTLIEPEELDQGQYDGRSDTFAVNSAGMLIRRDVWELLGGFDPALPGTGDDVDFCWRNRLAGNRVVVVPTAKIFHVVERPHGLGTPAAARKAQVHLRLKHAPLWMVPVHAVLALLGSLFTFFLSVAVKDPGHGLMHLAATCSALARPRALARARNSARKTRLVRRSVIRELRTSRREVWSHRRSLLEALGADNTPAEDLTQDALQDQPSGDAADDFAALATTKRGWVGNGALAAVIIATVAAMLALAGLFRAPAAAGGALLPVSATLAEIWQHASGWWISLGAGLPGRGDPFGYVLWVLGLLGSGDANAALAWLFLLSTPLSALTAWFAAGGLTVRRRLRFVAALSWAAAPALQIAANQGRAGALIAHIMLPLVILALLRATGTAVGHGRFTMPAPGDRPGNIPPIRPGVNGTPSWTAAAAAGLALAVVTASAPSLLVPSVVVVVLCGVLLGRRGTTAWWALLPTAALFIPFALSTLDRPRALLADPGLPLGFDPAPLWQQVLGQPLNFGIWGGLTGLPVFQGNAVPWALILALVVAAPIVVLAVAALFMARRRAGTVRFLWVAAVLALAGGWFAGQVATSASGDVLVSPFTGPSVSMASIALLGAAILGAEGLVGTAENTLAKTSTKGRGVRAAMAAGLVLLLAGPVLGMAAWATQNLVGAPAGVASQEPGLGAQRLVAAASPRTLPATAIDRGTGPEQSRTLLISVREDGTVDASLARGSGTTLDALSTIASARNVMGAPGAESLRTDDDVTSVLRAVVATVVAGQGVDPRADLEQLGAGFVVLRAADSAAQLTANRIDAVPGLVAVGQTDMGWLWRITPASQSLAETGDVAHRVRITSADGTTLAVIPSSSTDVAATAPAGPEGRLLVLAERADPNWSAWLDGTKLTASTAGWSQAFVLPAQGGELSVRYATPWEPWTGIAQLGVIGLTVLLAIPMPAPRRRTPTQTLPRTEIPTPKVKQHA